MKTAASPHALARRAHNDAIRKLYEDTLVPVREIARVAGVTERNVYALVRRLGCRPRVRLASGGGRRVVPFAVSPAALDADSAAALRQSCKEAAAALERLADEARAVREKRSASRRDLRAARTQARGFALLARAIRDLTAMVEAEDEPPREPKPKRRRPYVWKPGLVSPVR